MKQLLILLLCCCALATRAQVYNNEWIDHNKTYFKVKVGKTGLHRIAKTELAAASLSTTPVEHFQLWRNGTEVPIYTTVSAGAMPDGGFIEFWGERNDGKPDKGLYRRPENQLSDRFSLHTDTSVYFLTINPVGTNKRLENIDNNLTGNTLTPEPYFMYTLGQYFNNQLNGGFALDLDSYLYSSAYDLGEGYCSPFIGANGTSAINHGNLFAASSGPDAKFLITVAGNRSVMRRYRVKINNDSIIGNQVDFFNATTDTTTVPLAVISTAANNVQVTNISGTAGDRLAIYKYELTYPRQFNFGNAVNFEFDLPASNAPRYLEINAFNNGGLQPILLDRANGLRLLGDIAVAGKIRFLLPPLSQPGSMVLYSQAGFNLTNTTGLQQRRFTNYMDAANQGDYLIISNQILFDNSTGVNAVAQYAQYRRSATGGTYNPQVYDVEELVDQFGFGIKKTPLALRNFILFSLNQFAVKPRHVLLMGKGTIYNDQRAREADPNINRLNLVPTFGNPASDVLLAALPGTALPLVSIGRLSVVSPQEILDYLEKVKQYEAAQTETSPDPAQMSWKKNVAHIIGSGDPNLQANLEAYMSVRKNIISDTLWGADVHTFTKKSGANVEQISDKALESLFEEGISLITYFGHSSNTGLDYNLDNPDAYRNTGKYPLFVALGCNAGNFFSFNTNRFSFKDAISEKYVLAPQKGTIGFIASSHFGIVSALQPWSTSFYDVVARKNYGQTIGELMVATAKETLTRTVNGEENFMVRANIEENIYHGDPALRLNVQPKPDYVITDAFVKVEPGFVSIADTEFKLKVDVLNTGKAVGAGVILSVKRRYPDNTETELFRDSIAAPLLRNSFEYRIPVDRLRDKGQNMITVSIDNDDAVEELNENNNSISKGVFVYEDEARPVFPYNFSIVNNANVKLAVSTANPFSAPRAYQIEMDTTELFNSPSKWSQTLTSPGGLLEVSPGMALSNNTVYYWRVAPVPQDSVFRWNKSSFVYLPDESEGYNQSHHYQFQKLTFDNVELDSASRKFRFGKVENDLFVRNTIFPTGGNQEADFTVSVNGVAYIRSACVGLSLIFNVFDPKTFLPWKNVDDQGRNLFSFGSGSANCASSRNWNFEFSYGTAASRNNMVQFMKSIPEGYLVVVRNIAGNAQNQNTYAADWQKDTAVYGSNNSLYHALKNEGFQLVDSFYRPRSFIFMYQKGNSQVQPKSVVSDGIFDKITLTTGFKTPATAGRLISPKFGPATAWKQFTWEGATEASGDSAQFKIVGFRKNGGSDTLFSGIDNLQKTTDISGVDAVEYPYLQAVLETQGPKSYVPFQLNRLSLTGIPAPEGVIAPNIFYQIKDSLEVGEQLDFKVSFKNVSYASFDSLRVKMVITDANNQSQELPLTRLAPLKGSDTVHVRATIDSRQFAGRNSLFVQVNPDEDQPEQFSFNNFLYDTFYVKEDRIAPVVDVTFDNIRILNRDIVSARPDILIKLTDESRRLLLNDTSLFLIKVRNLSTNRVRSYRFDNDTLRFVPATGGGQNTASVNFKPFFQEDGEYELIVTAKDKRGNQAGGADYRVSFQVINKPMISNMLNYPNPFTTATAFVFTLTGSEVPSNLKIQILTVTGKIVREITREELGSLRIGRNITDFKWDGTDQFGQKLANGVYLYRVVAQLNGKTLDKYKSEADPTDQYFNKGYGKMYLMR